MGDTDRQDVSSEDGTFGNISKMKLSQILGKKFEDDNDPYIGKTLLLPQSFILGIMKYEPCVVVCYNKARGGYICYPEDSIGKGAFHVVTKDDLATKFRHPKTE